MLVMNIPSGGVRFGKLTVLDPTRTRQLQTYLNGRARGRLNQPDMAQQLANERRDVGHDEDDYFETRGFVPHSREETGVWPYIGNDSRAGLFPLGEDGWGVVATNNWAVKSHLTHRSSRPMPKDTMNHLVFALREDPRAMVHPGQVVAEFVGNERRDKEKLKTEPIVDLVG